MILACALHVRAHEVRNKGGASGLFIYTACIDVGGIMATDSWKSISGGILNAIKLDAGSYGEHRPRTLRIVNDT